MKITHIRLTSIGHMNCLQCVRYKTYLYIRIIYLKYLINYVSLRHVIN